MRDGVSREQISARGFSAPGHSWGGQSISRRQALTPVRPPTHLLVAHPGRKTSSHAGGEAAVPVLCHGTDGVAPFQPETKQSR